MARRTNSADVASRRRHENELCHRLPTPRRILKAGRTFASSLRAAVRAGRDEWRVVYGPDALVLIDLDGCGTKAPDMADLIGCLRRTAGEQALILAAGARSTRAHQRACRQLGVTVLPSGQGRDAADNALLARARTELHDRQRRTFVVSRDAAFARLPTA